MGMGDTEQVLQTHRLGPPPVGLVTKDVLPPHQERLRPGRTARPSAGFLKHKAQSFIHPQPCQPRKSPVQPNVTL